MNKMVRTTTNKHMTHSRKKLLWTVVGIFVLAVAAAWAYFYVKDGNKLFGFVAKDQSTQQVNNIGTNNDTTQQLSERKFNIPELGITLTLPEGLEGLEYTVVTDDYTKDLSANITTKDLLKDETCRNIGGGIGSIKRLSESPEVIYKNVVSSADWKKVGSYYYVLRGPQSPCSYDSNVASIQGNQANLLRKTVSTIEPYPEK